MTPETPPALQRRPVLSLLALACLGACTLLLVGCSSGVPVNGTVVENGGPVALKDGETLSVALVEEGGDNKVFAATADRDGSFRVAQKVPPGKYQVTVAQLGDIGEWMKNRDKPGGPKLGPKGPGGPVGGGPPERFKGEFSGTKSPFHIEVGNKPATLTVDVGKKTVTVQ